MPRYNNNFSKLNKYGVCWEEGRQETHPNGHVDFDREVTRTKQPKQTSIILSDKYKTS